MSPHSTSEPKRVTQLLERFRDGDESAFQQLIPIVYSELRALAGASLRTERNSHTLGATALAHETYLRLLNQRERNYQGRSHFFAVAAHTMRQILVDYARSRRAQKRGGAQRIESLEEARTIAAGPSAAVVQIDDALRTLERMDPRKAQLLEMRFFGGFTAEESAEHVDLPVTAVRRELRVAQAWLWRELAAFAEGKDTHT